MGVHGSLESDFAPVLKERLAAEFPGCVVLKQDPNMLQGVPDLLVLYQDKWALLETKRGSKASKRPNQPYWVERFNEMSYSAFVSPENVNEVMHALQSTFGTGG